MTENDLINVNYLNEKITGLRDMRNKVETKGANLFELSEVNLTQRVSFLEVKQDLLSVFDKRIEELQLEFDSIKITIPE